MTTTRLHRTAAGDYTYGAYTITGLATTNSGRTGSRINKWLVSLDGHIVFSAPTLARVAEYLTAKDV